MPEPLIKKKVAGVSRNYWLAGGAIVGLLFYVWYKRKQASARRPDTISTLPEGMPGGADTSTTDLTPKALTFNSLQDWMAHTQSWANSLGFDAAEVQSALQAYSIGSCLTSTQYKIIDQALGLFGMPPQAPYQGVVLCHPEPTITPPTPTPKAKELFLGSGFGPPGGGSQEPGQGKPIDWATQEQLLQGLDGNCYQWIPGEAANAALGSDVQRYIEIAPRAFFPNVLLPPKQAALYIRVPCPVGGGVPLG